MAKRLVKIVLWSLGGVFALALVAYAVLFLVNLEDQPPGFTGWNRTTGLSTA